MNNDKFLEIKKKPQELNDEELNKISGGETRPDSRFGDDSSSKGKSC